MRILLTVAALLIGTGQLHAQEPTGLDLSSSERCRQKTCSGRTGPEGPRGPAGASITGYFAAYSNNDISSSQTSPGVFAVPFTFLEEFSSTADFQFSPGGTTVVLPKVGTYVIYYGASSNTGSDVVLQLLLNGTAVTGGTIVAASSATPSGTLVSNTLSIVTTTTNSSLQLASTVPFTLSSENPGSTNAYIAILRVN